MTKTLICLLPPLDYAHPSLSGAILAGICTEQGHHVTVSDINIELRNYLRSLNISDNFFDDVFYEMTSDYSDNQLKIIKDFLDHFFQRIQVNEFDYVAKQLMIELENTRKLCLCCRHFRNCKMFHKQSLNFIKYPNIFFRTH